MSSGQKDLLVVSRARTGETFHKERKGLRFDKANLRRAGMNTFVSYVPDEHSKQPANV